MEYRRNSIEWLEEEICSCGAGHGSNEGHVDWCKWLSVKKFICAAKAAGEFLATPSLIKTRHFGEWMTRKQVLAELKE